MRGAPALRPGADGTSVSSGRSACSWRASECHASPAAWAAKKQAIRAGCSRPTEADPTQAPTRVQRGEDFDVVWGTGGSGHLQRFATDRYREGWLRRRSRPKG